MGQDKDHDAARESRARNATKPGADAAFLKERKRIETENQRKTERLRALRLANQPAAVSNEYVPDTGGNESNKN